MSQTPRLPRQSLLHLLSLTPSHRLQHPSPNLRPVFWRRPEVRLSFHQPHLWLCLPQVQSPPHLLLSSHRLEMRIAFRRPHLRSCSPRLHLLNPPALSSMKAPVQMILSLARALLIQMMSLAPLAWSLQSRRRDWTSAGHPAAPSFLQSMAGGRAGVSVMPPAEWES